MPRITPEEWTRHPERFDEAAANPRYQKGMSAVPPPVPITLIVALLGFLVFWLLIGGPIFISSLDVPSLMFPAVAGFLLLFGIAMVVGMVAKHVRFARAPIERKLVVVIDERTEVTGGGKNSSARTRYYATLQDRDGERAELETSAAVAGMVTRGDIGVALLRLDQLVAFHRIDV